VRSGNTILLAEDLKDDELHFKHTLRRAGLGNRVIVVHDGEETIAYLEGAGCFSDRESFPRPRILVADLKMPRLSGWEVLEWVRSQAEFDDILVVVLTASLRVEDLHRAYLLGASSFLIKPCRAADLADLAETFPEHWWGSPATMQLA